jgi:DNA polymerase III epsilon subunit-like protein
MTTAASQFALLLNNLKDRRVTVQNVMIDMEFLDTRPTAAILSIGAVKFDTETGKLGDTFSVNVSPDDCTRRHGMTISSETVKWWLDQDPKAIKAAFAIDKAMMLELALVKLANFLSGIPIEKRVIYSQGSLDLEILKFAWTKLPDPNATIPWHFRNERDSRTLANLFPEVSVPNVGSHHNALDDAIYQANLVMAIHKHIRELSQPSSTKKKVIPAVVEAQDDEL